MSTSLLFSLSHSLESLAGPSTVSSAELFAKVGDIWQNAWSPPRGGQDLNDKQLDAVKAVLEVVGRQLILSSLKDGTLPEPPTDSTVDEKQAFQEGLQYRLDIALTLFESAYVSLQSNPVIEPGAIFIPILEELVELISVESWRDLWTYIETRSKRFTKDMPASRGKALPLLRTINAFLRFLPRTPEDLVFRGRVHQFASSVISIADKSAINLRGDYNEVKTVWDEPITEEQAGDGDIEMEEKKETDQDKKNTDTKTEADFYSTLWSLQQSFAHPPSLAPSPQVGTPRTPSTSTTPTPFASFRQKSEIVLPVLFEQTKKQKELMGREVEGVSKKRKRGESAEQEGGFFHPRYLTGKKLLEHELADPSFRRQILVQYFILFQFLLHLTPGTASKQAFTGGMPKNFVIEASDETWVRETVSSIREELRRMPPDGPRFEKTVLSIITRESHYAAWKNEGCPEGVFEVPPMDNGSAVERAELWKRRLSPPRRFRFNVGTMALSDMWRGGYSNIDQLRNWKRKSDVESLYEEIEAIDADEEDDKAMGVDIPTEKLNANEEQRTSLTWRALRLRTKTDIRQLTALKMSRDLNILFKPQAVKKAADVPAPVEPKKEKEGESGTPETPVVTAEVVSEAVAEVEVPVSGSTNMEAESKDVGKLENGQSIAEAGSPVKTPEEGKMEVDKAE